MSRGESGPFSSAGAGSNFSEAEGPTGSTPERGANLPLDRLSGSRSSRKKDMTLLTKMILVLQVPHPPPVGEAEVVAMGMVPTVLEDPQVFVERRAAERARLSLQRSSLKS